jgi:hypothetical protein
MIQLAVFIPSWSIWPIGVGILAWFGWSFYKSYQTADEAKKSKLIKLYAIMAVVTVVLFCGIKFSGLSERLFPEHYMYPNLPLK